MIVDLYDAAAFIGMHGERTRLWGTAETAVKCADHNPSQSIKPPRPSKALGAGKPGLIGSLYPCDALQCCICMLIGAADGIIMFSFMSAMIHMEPATTTKTMSTPNASARTLFVLSGPVVTCRKNTR
jgi:hypothetical protein